MSFYRMMCSIALLVVGFLYFLFFKQKTAYEMRISDWSSDVCSSDLILAVAGYSIVDIEVVATVKEVASNSTIARRWDFGNWEIGVVARCAGSEGSFVVLYDCGDTYTHTLSVASYMGGLGAPVGSWVLLEKCSTA